MLSGNVSIQVSAASLWEPVMENTIEMQFSAGPSSESLFMPASESARSTSEERLSILQWYRILRAHYQWPLFEAIRFALWLSR
jgi:hypothetical protein